MAKSKTTSKEAATAASKVLSDGRIGKNSKTAAASALAQAVPKKEAPKKPAPKKPLPNAPSKKEGQKSGGGRGNAESKKN